MVTDKTPDTPSLLLVLNPMIIQANSNHRPAQFVRNVLLIDDNPSCNFIMTEFIKLTNDQIVVRSCESVEEALEFLSNAETKFPDVIYVDLNMPVLNGFDFIESFERVFAPLHSECSLFMLTSSLREDDRVRAMGYQSVKDFVSKNEIDEFLDATLRKNVV